jgi:hypothetical protein
MAMKKTSQKSAAQKTCEYCGQAVDGRGYAGHVKACGKRNKRQAMPEKEKLLRERAKHGKLYYISYLDVMF